MSQKPTNDGIKTPDLDDQSEGENGSATDKAAILNRYSFYREADAALRRDIEQHAVAAHLDPTSRFFDVGMLCGHVALVGKGSVRVSVQGETGREITLYHVAPGETCPVNLLCALLNRPTPATAYIEKPLDAVVLPTETVRRWVAEQDVVRRFVLESIAGRLVAILSLLQEITFGRLDRRLAEFLVGGFAQSASQPPAIEKTHERIAVELSSAREVITRLLREFERRGAVEVKRGRVLLRDADLLKRIGFDI